jgi:hypothetical protein
MVDARWSVVFVSSTGTQNNLSIADAASARTLISSSSRTPAMLTITGIAAPTCAVTKYGKPLDMICDQRGECRRERFVGALGTARRTASSPASSGT